MQLVDICMKCALCHFKRSEAWWISSHVDEDFKCQGYFQSHARRERASVMSTPVRDSEVHTYAYAVWSGRF